MRPRIQDWTLLSVNFCPPLPKPAMSMSRQQRLPNCLAEFGGLLVVVSPRGVSDVPGREHCAWHTAGAQ